MEKNEYKSFCDTINDIYDYSSIKNMSNLLENFKGEYIPQLDTANVEYMNGMFENCYKLKNDMTQQNRK